MRTMRTTENRTNLIARTIMKPKPNIRKVFTVRNILVAIFVLYILSMLETINNNIDNLQSSVDDVQNQVTDIQNALGR